MEDEIFKIYQENKAKAISMKMAALKFCDASGGYYGSTNKHHTNLITSKSGNVENVTEIEKTIVGNTYLWLDSHQDVHMKGCFANSIKNDMTPAHLHDHEFKILSQVGDVLEVKEQRIAWKTLNVELDGFTEALLIKSNVKAAYNQQFFDMYNENKIQQHSVGMRYVDLAYAVDSDGEYWKEEKALYDEVLPKIGNKDTVGKSFWVVKEAKLIEVSAVLRGSNELTPTIKEDKEQSKDALIKSIRNNLKFLKNA